MNFIDDYSDLPTYLPSFLTCLLGRLLETKLQMIPRLPIFFFSCTFLPCFRPFPHHPFPHSRVPTSVMGKTTKPKAEKIP